MSKICDFHYNCLFTELRMKFFINVAFVLVVASHMAQAAPEGSNGDLRGVKDIPEKPVTPPRPI